MLPLALGTMLLDVGTGVDMLYNLFTLPSIGLPVSTDVKTATITAALATFGILRGIPIAATKCDVIGEVQIGNQIMLRTEEKGNDMITDNATPQPLEWQLEGYLTTKLLSLQGLVEQEFVSMNPIAIVANKALKGTIFSFIEMYFEYLRTSRAPFYFTDDNSAVHEVLMKNYRLIKDPMVQNSVQVKFTLTEYISLAVVANKTQIGTKVKDGSAWGKAATIGSYVAPVLATSAGAIKRMFS